MNIQFSQDDYTAIAKELYRLIKENASALAPTAQPTPTVVTQPATAPAPAVVPLAPAPAPVAPAPVPAPVPAVPALKAVTYHGDAQGNRIDDIVPAGTPGTVTLPVTGHTLSLPVVPGEGHIGYFGRVREQAGGPGAVYNFGDIMYRGDGLFAQFGGYKADGSNWPQGADWYYNQAAYAAHSNPQLQAQVDAYNRSIGWDGIPGHPNDPWISGSRTPSPEQAVEQVAISS